MISVYRIAEGYGDPQNPETLFGVEFLEITFSNFHNALEFAEAHYNQKTKNNPEWQSYWNIVTTATTTRAALAEIAAQLQKVQPQ
jgi:hypothetical protein